MKLKDSQEQTKIDQIQLGMDKLQQENHTYEESIEKKV